MNKKTVLILSLILVICAFVALLVTWNITGPFFGVLSLALVFWVFYHLLPACLLSLPVWILGRDRAKWVWWEFSILVIPYFVWVIFFLIDDRGKSPANLVEAFWLGCTIPLAALIRVLIGQSLDRKRVAVGLIATYSIAAVIIWALVEPMPMDKG